MRHEREGSSGIIKKTSQDLTHSRITQFIELWENEEKNLTHSLNWCISRERQTCES